MLLECKNDNIEFKRTVAPWGSALSAVKTAFTQRGLLAWPPFRAGAQGPFRPETFLGLPLPHLVPLCPRLAWGEACS